MSFRPSHLRTKRRAEKFRGGCGSTEFSTTHGSRCEVDRLLQRVSSGILIGMPKKKKPRLRVGKEARRRARLGIGLPPPERAIPNKREKSEKHKKTLGEILDD